MAYLLKDKFRRLAWLLNNTGLCVALEREENAEDLKDLWKYFQDTNRLLIIEANKWKKYYKSFNKPIFKAFEEVRNPLAVACLIRIMGMREEELFMDKDDLKAALKKENGPFSKTVASLMDEKAIIEITAEDIFK